MKPYLCIVWERDSKRDNPVCSPWEKLRKTRRAFELQEIDAALLEAYSPHIWGLNLAVSSRDSASPTRAPIHTRGLRALCPLQESFKKANGVPRAYLGHRHLRCREEHEEVLPAHLSPGHPKVPQCAPGCVTTGRLTSTMALGKALKALHPPVPVWGSDLKNFCLLESSVPTQEDNDSNETSTILQLSWHQPVLE